jgi:hypothetical protein
LVLALQTAHNLASSPCRMGIAHGKNLLFDRLTGSLRARVRTARPVYNFLLALPSAKPFISRVRVDAEPPAKFSPVRPPPASQAAQTRAVDPSPTSPAMAWIWPPKLPNPCTMMCRSCPRTPVGDVPGLNNKPGHDGKSRCRRKKRPKGITTVVYDARSSFNLASMKSTSFGLVPGPPAK